MPRFLPIEDINFIYVKNCFNDPVNMIDFNGREPISISIFLLIYLALCIAGYITLRVLFSPSRQQSWKNLCTALAEGVSTVLTSIGDLTVSFVEELSAQAKTIAQSIADSFARTKVKPKYRKDTEVHHIVAKKAKNASKAREIINRVGIGYESPLNKITIKTGLHRRIHTDVYYGWANSVVISAYNAADPIKSKQKKNVLKALDLLRTFISMLNDMAPY